MIQLVENAREYQDNVAIIDDSDEYAYHELLEASEKLAQVLLCEQNDLCEQRIAFIINPGFDYVKTQWAIWRAGGIAVPLHPKAPLASHDYVLNDAQVSQLVVDSDKTSAYKEIANQLNIRLITPEASSEEAGFALPEITLDRRAMIVYTSGTTGNPKGVVTTHSNIEHQITALTKAWEWSAEDHIINVLPMHHVHGIINVLSCALWSGAICEFASFDAEKILYKLAEGKANLFMAVPTIYYKLITAFEALES
ncbi:MAG: AMP-binding protein, partial [Bacteroidota bacterium]